MTAHNLAQDYIEVDGNIEMLQPSMALRWVVRGMGFPPEKILQQCFVATCTRDGFTYRKYRWRDVPTEEETT